ncbi:MAG: XdhC family protein [Alphaproteobacteria bacterium]
MLVGAGPIAQALTPMATLAGFAVTVIDPHTATFATEPAPDARTAVVTLSHEARMDDPALMEALRSQAFYIGALGSTRTHAQRLERLGKQGFDPVALSRIHGPVGLALGGRAPAEIAVSILAHLIQIRHRAS